MDALGILALVSLLLYFFIPNKSGAGMMNYRFLHILFFLFLLWLSSRLTNSNFNLFFILVLFLVLFRFYITHFEPLSGNAKSAEEVVMSAEVMKENSIVLPITLGETWLQPHYSNYLAYSKDFIILENYEASMEWFPVSWIDKDLGEMKYRDIIDRLKNRENVHQKGVIPEYIFIYGNTTMIEDDERIQLKELLTRSYHLVYKSDDSDFIQVFELNQ